MNDSVGGGSDVEMDERSTWEARADGKSGGKLFNGGSLTATQTVSARFVPF